MNNQVAGWYVKHNDRTYNQYPFKSIVAAYNWAIDFFGDEETFELYEVKS